MRTVTETTTIEVYKFAEISAEDRVHIAEFIFGDTVEGVELELTERPCEFFIHPDQDDGWEIYDG